MPRAASRPPKGMTSGSALLVERAISPARAARVGVVAGGAVVVAAPHADHAHAVLAGERDRVVRRQHAGHLAGPVVAVHERDPAALALDPRPRPRVEAAAAQPLRVDGDAGHPVRVDAAQAGVDQRGGHGGRRLRLEPRGPEDVPDPRLQHLRLQRHAFFHA